jgi:ribosome-associated protein
VPASNEAVGLAVSAAAAADDKKALDPVLLDVADVLAVVDLFLLVSTTSDRQLDAVVGAIEERLRDGGRRVLRREGTPASGWVLLDYGDLVCHVFTVDQREHYALERLWSDVPSLDPTSGAPMAAASRRASVGADTGA